MEETTPEMIFAALKLIEQLYHDGHISQKMFRDILFEHSDVIVTNLMSDTIYNIIDFL